MNQPQLSADRRIRVFVSSIFRDMQVDRDVLVKKVFPRLREWCERRKLRQTKSEMSRMNEKQNKDQLEEINSAVLRYYYLRLTHSAKTCRFHAA